ncbi:Uncharacterized protein AB751O23_CV_00020 [Chlamydiales bacterium SCGC AB-751-O23]|nr:Uncharacterized protein AB751O23_CV_00020 [Chlamydiales bacterium SCGC AB-751-O23]
MKVMIEGFLSKEVFLCSSALTFYTILSLVPALALAFGIAKGFNLEGFLEENIRALLSSQTEVADYLIQFSSNLLNNTKEEVIAGVGVLILLWSAMSLLSNIEYAFNLTWKVKTQRSFKKKIFDYIPFFFLSPLFLILSAASLHFLSSKHEILNIDSQAILIVVKFSPVCFLWLLFLFLYRFLPFTHVKVLPALVASLFTSFLSFFFQWVFVTFMIKLMNYGVVYGSFAVLPLFLLWININWILVLEGCKLCYFLQNFRFLLWEPLYKYSSQSQWQLLWLLVKEFAHQKSEGQLYCTFPQLKKALKVPDFMLIAILEVLEEGEWVAKVVGRETVKYSLIKNSENIDFAKSLELIMSKGDSIDLNEEGTREQIKVFLEACSGLEENIPLKES